MDMKLRERAEQQLEKGTAPTMREWHVGTPALKLLHGLASAPQTASDALKLLHELQVHQVELDLQHEQAEQERRQHTEDLAHCTALFDFAPFACLSLNAKGVVMAALRESGGWQTCAVQFQARGTSAQAVASATSGGEQVLMAFVPPGA